MATAGRQPPPDGGREATFARLIGRSRLIVVVAVVAVMLAAFSLFLLGAVLAANTMWAAWVDVLQGNVGSTDLTIRFLEIVTVMLKAVFFYLIGVGLYSLFISPLNVTVALGVETLNDLETKIISVVIVIMAVSFLERFIRWQSPLEIVLQAAALGIAVAALVFFKIHTHREGQEHKRQHPDILERAKMEMFQRDQEKHEITPDEIEVRVEDSDRERARESKRKRGT